MRAPPPLFPTGAPSNGGNVCFNCQQPGHMARECPEKQVRISIQTHSPSMQRKRPALRIQNP